MLTDPVYAAVRKPVTQAEADPTLPVRTLTVTLAWTAAAIHLFLTPEHFGERTVYGVFFLAASVFQLVLGWFLLRRPTSRVFAAGALGSLLLIATWIVTRAIAPPLSPEGRPEPVTALGVFATGAELATLVIVASAAPLPRTTRRGARVWGTAAGITFAALLFLASGAVSYLPNGATRFWSLSVYWGSGPSVGTPLVYGSLAPHVWLVGTWLTLSLIAIAAVLVAANVAAALRWDRGVGRCTARRGRVAALTPALLVVSSCCGTPLALLLGTSAVVFLYQATPWLLLATVGFLAASLAIVRRGRSLSG